MKKNMTGNRKFNRRRFIAAAGAGLTAAAVLITAVLGRSIEAEAADDTLIGIEKLRARVKESGKEFVVLEIVPDRAAAEIGFLFRDLEPILDEWDKDAMEWNKWENILCSLPSFEERFEFVESKKEDLKAYYAQVGLTSAFPVTVEDGDYVENDEPASGFRKITSDSVKRSGWFEKADAGKGNYQVSFTDAGPYDKDGSFAKNVLYYSVSGEPVAVRNMTEEELNNVSPDTFVYVKFSSVPEGDVYNLAGTWKEVQEQALKSVMSQPGDEEQDDSGQSDEEDAGEKNKDDKDDGDDSKDSGDSEGTEDGDKQEGEDAGNSGDGSDADEGTDNGESDNNGDVDGGSTGAGDGGSDSSDGAESGEGSNTGGNVDGDGESNSTGGNGDGSGEGGSTGSNVDGNDGDNNAGGNGDGNGNDSSTHESGEAAGTDVNGDTRTEQGVDTTAKASIPLSVNINQGRWFLLVEGNPADDSDGQKTSEDTGSNNTGTENTGSENAGSGDTGSENAGSENTGSGDVGSENTGSDSTDSDNTDSGNAGSDNAGSDDQNSDNTGSDNADSDESNSGESGDGGNIGSDDESAGGEDVEDGEGAKNDAPPAKDVLANEETAREYYFVQFERYKQVEGERVYAVREIVESSSGQYVFRECDAIEDQEGVTYQTYTFPGRTIYCKNTFKSNEWFRRYVINMDESDYEDFPVKVLTLTPQELNAMEQKPNFDFLYLNSGLRAWGTPGGNVADSGSTGDEGNGGSNEGGAGGEGTGSGTGGEGTGNGTGEGTEGGTGDESSGVSVGEDNGGEDSGVSVGEDNGGEDSGVSTGEDNGDESSGVSAEEGNEGEGVGNTTVEGNEGTTEEGNGDGDEPAGQSLGDDSGEGGSDGSPVDATLSVSASENQGNWMQYVSLDAEDPESGNTGSVGDGSEGNGSGEGTTDTNPEEEVTYATYVTEGNDLSSDVLKYFFEKAIAGAKPCLVDGSILYVSNEDSGGTVVNEELEKTNIFRLAAMLCQDKLSEWYEDHRSNYGNLTTKQLMDGIVEDADKNFVTDQVYCRYGDDSIVNDLFYTTTIYEEGGVMEPGFQPVLDEILLENQYREADSSGNYKPLPTKISQATAVRHILNYSDRRKVETKKDIKVLEIQPAKVDEWTDAKGNRQHSELTLEQIQKWAPDVETAEITVMTTAEFIGKIEKLNENYDLIYIGTSTDHLNMRYWTDKNYTGKPNKDHPAAGTAFNDSDMDGLIYYNIGDLRGIGMSVAGQLDTEYWGGTRNDNVYYYNLVRYGGNDITEEKKEALLSFLDGSYPIVVADDFFESPVTVYATPGYKESRVSLSEGEYHRTDLVALGVAGGDISAVKVKKGYKITLYNDYDFLENGSTRLSVSFTKDESDFNTVRFGNGNGNWNNKPNSLKVERLPDAVPERTIDGDHIDNCTYMYEFVEQAMKDNYVNFYAWSDITDESELFKFYLNRPKVSLTDVTVNGKVEEDSGSDVRYIEAGINGKYNLQYSFTIKNEGAASYNTCYECKLYIDINSDGKFSEQEEISDINMTQGGSYASPKELYADRTYLLTREVPSGYKGLLPWKVEITQTDNKNIYTSMQGYTKLEGMEQEQIKVIQIGRDEINDAPSSWNFAGERLFDLGAEINAPNSYFNILVKGGTGPDGIVYSGIKKDYDIDVTFFTIPQFEEAFKNNPSILDDYNMLILGFSDMYKDFSLEPDDTPDDGMPGGAMGAILNFVNSGKSVLFAHDTTSFINYPKGEGNYQTNRGFGYKDRGDKSKTGTHSQYHFAYTLNTYLRNLVGMDRYGVLDSGILKKGLALSSTGDNASLFEELVKSREKRYDIAYKPKSGKKQTVPEVHGYTYLVVNGQDEGKADYSAAELGSEFHNKYTNIRYEGVNGEGVTNGQVSGMYVTQVNKGQITEYPYRLKESFLVAQTHGQYYELDYTADDDDDGESDLVVWYCLGGIEASKQETIYSQSPNDVRNNYYIYNKGNITYTGMGHNMHKSPRYEFEEAKLFINTIIAAYQAGVKAPYISVLKTGEKGSQELKTLHRYYDPANTFSLSDSATTEDYEKIYFTVQDINFVKGSRAITTKLYYKIGSEDGRVSIDVYDDDNEKITVNPLEDAVGNVQMFTKDGSPVEANNLQSGGIYYVLMPKSFLENCESGLNLYFEAETTLTTNTTNENVYKTDKVYAKLQVLQAYLFNLE